MKKNLNRVYGLFSFLLLCACNDTATQQQQTTPATVSDTTTVQQRDTAAIPPGGAMILNASSYHGDEVGDSVSRKSWTGLFRNAGGYYLDATRIQTARVYDAVLDESENGPHTGIEVRALHKDTAILLISGVPYLRTGPVTAVPELSAGDRSFFTLQPGDSSRFNYAGHSYTLIARGTKKQVDDQPGNEIITDYRLYLAGDKNGKRIEQLLTAQKNLDDTLPCIIFCGDLDGDGLPDFLIDTTDHYNVFQPTLYLSAQAAADKLLLRVAKHTSVGC
ncbi:hypothetical protein [Taibaiella chishuiensis]|uniref:VCBS repeat protein n=1 Tax=Taibaiella chishuiensis TaxID=1434707 RepID=A0A2P8CV95_9BACT|nr:hypothetical protein [Taibaiella chishuiensis]PSK88880.1 hypothetical protein B0I18_11492 [Taibaiella chishuiensis]